MLFNLSQNSNNQMFHGDDVTLDEEEDDYGAVNEFDEEEEDNEGEDIDEEEDDEDGDEENDLDDEDELQKKQPCATYGGEDEEEGDYALSYFVAK